MDINEILYKICEDIGKERTYKGTLTRKLNAIIKEKTDTGYDFLPQEQLERIGIIALLKEFNLEDVDKYFNGEAEESKSELEEDNVLEEVLKEEISEESLKEEEEEELSVVEEPEFEKKEVEFKPSFTKRPKETPDLILDEIKKDKPVTKNIWNEFFEMLPEKNDGKFINYPTLQIKDNLTYFIKIKDPKSPPYKHEGIGYGNNPYTSWAFNIVLIKVSPEDFNTETYEKGDFKGELLYTNNREYKFWLSDKHRGTFAKFWTDTLGLDDFDGRIFAFRRTSKLSKKNRQYKIFKFMTVKSN